MQKNRKYVITGVLLSVTFLYVLLYIIICDY